jgi:hypothetical protein
MSNIKRGAEWYVAQIIIEISVEGETQNVVHKNFVLISANSAEEAYQKAISLGKQSDDYYKNPSGKSVLLKFKGLHGLNVVYDELEDGSELLYEERFGLSSEDLMKEIVEKTQLAVFRLGGRPKTPDYSSEEIVDDAKRLLEPLSD